MRIKEGFMLKELAGNYVVVPVGKEALDFNGMMNLNETGAFLFEKMKSEVTKKDLTEELINHYNINKEKAYEDVEYFIEEVKGANLFE